MTAALAAPAAPSKKVLMIITHDSVASELVGPWEVFRRIGMDVTVASVDTETVEVLSDTKIKMIADVPFSAVNQDEYDAIVVPGGISAHTLSQNEEVKRLLQRYHAQGKLLALICAAPTILAAAKVAPGIRITSYPLFEDHFEDYVYVKDPVVIEGNIITSRGPATTFDFAMAIVGYLLGDEILAKAKAENVFD